MKEKRWQRRGGLKRGIACGACLLMAFLGAFAFSSCDDKPDNSTGEQDAVVDGNTSGKDEAGDTVEVIKGPTVSAEQWKKRISTLSKDSGRLQGTDASWKGNVFYTSSGDFSGMIYNVPDKEEIVHYSEGESLILYISGEKANSLKTNMRTCQYMFDEVIRFKDGENSILLADAYHLFTYDEETATYEATLQVIIGEQEQTGVIMLKFEETGILTITVEGQVEVVYGEEFSHSWSDIYQDLHVGNGTPQGPVTPEQWATAVANLTTDKITRQIISEDYNTNNITKIDGNIFYEKDSDDENGKYTVLNSMAQSITTYVYKENTWGSYWVYEENAEGYEDVEREYGRFKDIFQEMLDLDLAIFHNDEMIKLQDSMGFFTYDGENDLYTITTYIAVEGAKSESGANVFCGLCTMTVKFVDNEVVVTLSSGDAELSEERKFTFGGNGVSLPNGAISKAEYDAKYQEYLQSQSV